MVYYTWILFGFKLGITSIPPQCTGFVLGVLPRNRFHEGFLGKKHPRVVEAWCNGKGMFTGMYLKLKLLLFSFLGRTSLKVKVSINFFVDSLKLYK